jgi:hypothetical protein
MRDTLRYYSIESFFCGITCGTVFCDAKARFYEQEIVRRYWYTRTFARRGGRWQIVTAGMLALAQDEH